MRHKTITPVSSLKEKGPLLLACNHPNSFLDGIILDTYFEQPVYALARGDAFKNKIIAGILASLKLLPVYRTSEGVENLSENYKTFDACIKIFRKNGIVQIFSEGKSVNEWHLRPLRKGTARLALQSWQEGIPLRVLPVGINYSSFKKFGKNIIVKFGSVISEKDIPPGTDGFRHLAFNKLLTDQLSRLVLEIPIHDVEARKKKFKITYPVVEKFFLALPALPGLLLHIPLYLPVHAMLNRKPHLADHFDSIIVSVLFLLYPFYLLLIAGLLYFLVAPIYSLLTLLLPFCAWAYVRIKPQI